MSSRSGARMTLPNSARRSGGLTVCEINDTFSALPVHIHHITPQYTHTLIHWRQLLLLDTADWTHTPHYTSIHSFTEDSCNDTADWTHTPHYTSIHSFTEDSCYQNVSILDFIGAKDDGGGVTTGALRCAKLQSNLYQWHTNTQQDGCPTCNKQHQVTKIPLVLKWIPQLSFKFLFFFDFSWPTKFPFQFSQTCRNLQESQQ